MSDRPFSPPIPANTTPVRIKGNWQRPVYARDDNFRFITDEPRRIGDVCEIELLPVMFGQERRFVRAIWLEDEDGKRWLVELKGWTRFI